MIQGLPWQSSGLDPMFPMQGTQVQSLVGEQGSHMAQPKKKKRKKQHASKIPSTSRVMYGHVPCFQKSQLSFTTFSEEHRPECSMGPQPSAGKCKYRLVGSWVMGKIKWSFPALILMAPTSLSWVVVGHCQQQDLSCSYPFLWLRLGEE